MEDLRVEKSNSFQTSDSPPHTWYIVHSIQSQTLLRQCTTPCRWHCTVAPFSPSSVSVSLSVLYKFSLSLSHPIAASLCHFLEIINNLWKTFQRVQPCRRNCPGKWNIITNPPQHPPTLQPTSLHASGPIGTAGNLTNYAERRVSLQLPPDSWDIR